MPRSSRPQPALFVVVTVLYWTALYWYVPILSPHTQALGADLGFVGLVVSSYGLVQLLLRIPTGIWADRVGRCTPFLIGGLLAAAVSAWGMGGASTPGGMLAFRALSGVAATAWVEFTVFYAGYFPAAQITRAMGLVTFITSASQMGATFVGGLTAEAFGAAAPFYAAAGLGLAGAGLAFLLRDRPPGGAPPPLMELLAVGRNRRLAGVSLLAAIAQYATFSTVFGFTTVYAVSIGAGQADLGMLTLISQIPAALGSLLSGRWAVRLGERRLIAAGFGLSAGMTVIIPFVHSLALLNATQFIGGLGRGVSFPLLMSAALAAVPPAKKSTAMGYFQAIYSLGMFLGPMISGFLGNLWGLAGIFWVAGGVACGGAAAAWRWLHDPAAAESEPERADRGRTVPSA